MIGLDYCHTNGVVYRDLKPDNILLNYNYNIKIADFGVAASLRGRDGKGKLKTYCGTPEY